ncbi:MAG: response regulator transcription factor [Acidobacteriota bacterium]
MTKANIRILIADDHPVFRKGLRQVIEAESDLLVIGEATDGDAALAFVRQEKPDVAVVDVHMPGSGGFDFLRAIKKEKLAVAVIFLTMFNDETMFNTAMDLGAKGYVLKESAASDITASIRSVAAGRPYISPQLSGFLLNRSQHAAQLVEQHPGLNSLTPTERRILKLIADYQSSKEIAAELHIHYRTVDNHRSNICQKLNLHGSNALLKFAVENRSKI